MHLLAGESSAYHGVGLMEPDMTVCQWLGGDEQIIRIGEQPSLLLGLHRRRQAIDYPTS